MEIVQRVLPTGLTVILANLENTQTVTGFFAARAGWKYENETNWGIAHFLEHMAFKGTKNRPTKLDISKEVEGRGGLMNAFTSEEMTGYFFKLPYQFTNIACELVSDMLLNSKYEQEEIDKEKGTIIQELRMYLDSPQALSSQFVWPELLYRDQPAGTCGLGTEESINSFKRKDFLKFKKGLYVSENSAFCLAGKIDDIEKLFSFIQKCFNGIIIGEPTIEKPPVIHSQKKPELLLLPRPEINQSHMLVGVRSHDLFSPQKDALKILTTVLGGNMSSRMFMEVRERRGLAYYIRSLHEFQTDTGYLTTWAGIDKDKVMEAMKTMLKQYKIVCNKPIPEEELKRAKQYINGTKQMSMETSNGVAYDLIEQWIYTGKIVPLKKRVRKINLVTQTEVMTTAQEIFKNNVLNMAIVGPHDEKDEDNFKKTLRF